MLHAPWLLLALVYARTGVILLDDLALEVARKMPVGSA
jgi:hypothetical protein